MSNELFSTERVAEGLWQTMNGVDDGALDSHKIWLALPQDQKQIWHAEAVSAIDNWKKSKGYV
jgi:hypothetical protein